MPRLDSSALKAQQAVGHLRKLLVDAEVLSEEIRNHFGEDLALQTHVNGVADPFSIRIQVKYRIVRLNSAGEFRLRLSRDHLWRWVSSIEPRLICVFDGSTQQSYMADPKRAASLWDLATGESSTTSLTFRSNDKLDVDAVRRIIWIARLNYYAMLLSILEAGEVCSLGDNDVMRDHSLALFDYLKLIGIIAGDSVDTEFRATAEVAAENMARDYDVNLKHAMMLALLGASERVTRCGLPSIILENATELLGHVFRVFHRRQWLRLNKMFNKQWYPYGMKGLPPGTRMLPS